MEGVLSRRDAQNISYDMWFLRNKLLGCVSRHGDEEAKPNMFQWADELLQVEIKIRAEVERGRLEAHSY